MIGINPYVIVGLGVALAVALIAGLVYRRRLDELAQVAAMLREAIVLSGDGLVGVRVDREGVP